MEENVPGAAPSATDQATNFVTPPSSLMILEELVKAHAITTLMVTHGVDHALAVGDRLSMPHAGSSPLDLLDENKKRFTVQDVVDPFRGVLSVSFA